MSTRDEEAIETFMSVTGVSEATAIQKLEEHKGNLNEAVNAYLNESDRNGNQVASSTSPLNGAMVIDDFLPTSSFPSSRGLDPFSILDRNFVRSVFDNGTNFSSRSPFISHPREVREIPIEVKDGTGAASERSAGAPIIEDVTETAHDHGPEVHGTVIIDDDDSDDVESISAAQFTSTGERGNARSEPRASTVIDVPDYSNDIEEEMVRAAIEASKKDVSNQLYDDMDLEIPNDRPVTSHGEALEVDHSNSQSLQTAEQAIALRELEGAGSYSETEMLKSSALEGSEKVAPSNGRRQSQLEVGSSSFQHEAEDAEEIPLIRRRRRRSAINPVEISRGTEEFEVSPLSSPQQQHDSDHLPQHQESDIPSEEWGGISSVEHDEAVMLEAAMFGGIPEGGYHFPYAPHHLMQNGYSMHVPRPPSPSLTAQRLLREQQDDEYLAALQADREKELKAKEEREAALAEERLKEEKIRKQQQDEQEIEKQLAAKEALLPQEPPKDDEEAVTLLVRMPDGSRRGRRFLKSDKLQYLFDFIDVGRGVKPGTYRLVRPYPRRAFGDGESMLTLNELGLTSKQEALYLELI